MDLIIVSSIVYINNSAKFSCLAILGNSNCLASINCTFWHWAGCFATFSFTCGQYKLECFILPCSTREILGSFQVCGTFFVVGVGKCDILAIIIKDQAQFSTCLVINRIHCYLFLFWIVGDSISSCSFLLCHGIDELFACCISIAIFHVRKADLDCIIRKLDVSFCIVRGFRYLLISIIQAKGKFSVCQVSAFQYFLRFQSNICAYCIICKCSGWNLSLIFSCYYNLNIILSNQANTRWIFICIFAYNIGTSF